MEPLINPEIRLIDPRRRSNPTVDVFRFRDIAYSKSCYTINTNPRLPLKSFSNLRLVVNINTIIQKREGGQLVKIPIILHKTQIQHTMHQP
jgi:hypothetical protein